MIQFNNFPPAEPGDIELSPVGEQRIVDLGNLVTPLPEDRKALRVVNSEALDASGHAVGLAVMSAVNDDPRVAEKLLSPINARVERLVEQSLSSNFLIGVGQAIADVLEHKREGAVA